MQGFNMGRHVPNDSGTNPFNKSHPLGARASKLKTEGILTVRFECPFAIWCTHCNPEQIVGQGVRFNAEKKKVGNYFSTAIWSFRFKHTVCGGWIEVRTDPKNAEYVVVEGGRRRDLGLDKVLDGEIRLVVSEEEKERLERDGGFGALERKVVDKRKLLDERGRLEELTSRSERDWSDPYEKSKLLRREFRVGRRQRADDEKKGDALKEKFSLGIDLVEEKEEDGERARMVEFGELEIEALDDKPMFTVEDMKTKSLQTTDRGERGKKPSTAKLAAEKKALLQKKLTGNTRAAVDPFLHENIWQARVKRKRKEPSSPPAPQAVNNGTALVNYDSDSS